MTGLTTHVLDLAHGRPAAGMAVRLLRSGRTLAETITGADGRTPAPLIHPVVPGLYRLEFGVGDYFRRLGLTLPDPAFLETVALEIGLADTAAHYHVPLLVSPFGYSTYRGG